MAVFLIRQEGRILFRDRAMTYYGRWTYRFEEAVRRGADTVGASMAGKQY
jgi:hypothetical protein